MTALPHFSAYRRFALLYTADIVVEWFASIALMVLVYERTQSATAAAALLICKQVIPGSLVPVAGSRLERFGASRVLVGALIAQAAAFAVLATVGFGVLLLLLAAISGLAGGLVRSSLRAGMARRLDDDALVAGNAFLNIALGVAGIAGPALAAAVVSLGGAAPALVIAGLALLGLVVGASGLSLGTPGSGSAPVDDAPGADERVGPAASGLALPLIGLFAVVAAVMCIFSMDEPALLGFSEHALEAGVSGYGAIVLAWGAGITIGGLIFTRLTRWSMLRIYAVATLAAATGYIGMGLSPSLEVAVAFAVFGGIGNGMDWIAVVTLVQRATPKGRETWAATRLEAIATVAPGVGILLGGVLADLLSFRATLVVPGALAVLTIAAAALYLQLRGRDGRPAVTSPDPLLVPTIHGGTA